MVPVNVLENTSGVVPDASTGPLKEPDRMVMKSVATELVNRNVCPFTAPDNTEYSPAKLQEEMVTADPLEGIATVLEGNCEVFVHCELAV